MAFTLKNLIKLQIVIATTFFPLAIYAENNSNNFHSEEPTEVVHLSANQLICSAIEESLELEVIIENRNGDQWKEILAPYALDINYRGVLVLIAVRLSSTSEDNCSHCKRHAPSHIYDAAGNWVGINEVGVFPLDNLRSLTIREEWRFRPVPNAQQAIDERILKWYCRIRN